MASLALIVSLMFLLTFIMGPLALMLSYFKMKVLASIFGVLAILIGGYWCCFAPFPISIIGGISLVCGALALNKI
jgi:hypothetical protein